MRVISCNGCRVLRKGCSEACSLRPCLEWIKCPDSQANATIFLAKFYGRAGLLNLINAGPQNLRPAIFRSLLYDACGRVVNPVDGSVGLLCSGSWRLCEDAVEAVLRGAPITRMAAEAVETKNRPALEAAYDIRHVSRENRFPGSNDLHRVRTRRRFKNAGRTAGQGQLDESGNGSPIHQCSLSHQSEAAKPENSAGAEPSTDTVECAGIELDLTLGFERFKRREPPAGAFGSAEVCKMEPGD